MIFSSCQEVNQNSYMDKIKFDMDTIDEHGLEIGSENKSSVFYQFCIPYSDSLALVVFKIEPALDVYRDVAGEIACTENQMLCMGHTHPNNWKLKLINLAKLPYVGDIKRVSFTINK